jgi:hypothetical protein
MNPCQMGRKRVSGKATEQIEQALSRGVELGCRVLLGDPLAALNVANRPAGHGIDEEVGGAEAVEGPVARFCDGLLVG